MNNPAVLSYALSSSFYLSPSQIQSCDKYYILYWESRHLYAQLVSTGKVIREKITYIPVFKDDLTALDLAANPETQIKVSFRRLKGNLTGYVIISKVRANSDGMVIS